MKCGVAEGWQYPSTRGNLLTAGARWRYSLAQERSAHSDTTASVCAPGSLAVIYDASRAITLSLTLIQQFIYWCACIQAEVSFLRGGGQNNRLPSASATSIVSQETSHVTWFIGGKPDEAWFFAHMMAHRKVPVWCYRKPLKWTTAVLHHLHPYWGRWCGPGFVKNKVIKVSSWLRLKAANAKNIQFDPWPDIILKVASVISLRLQYGH